jgi:hypothetical protein
MTPEDQKSAEATDRAAAVDDGDLEQVVGGAVVKKSPPPPPPTNGGIDGIQGESTNVEHKDPWP